MKRIVIYSKDNCVYCDKAVKLAQQFQFDYLDVIVKKLDVDFTMEKLMELFPTARTFPQIVVDDENIGGYTELESLFKIKYD